jgi:hypothetical protein
LGDLVGRFNRFVGISVLGKACCDTYEAFSGVHFRRFLASKAGFGCFFQDFSRFFLVAEFKDEMPTSQD